MRDRTLSIQARTVKAMSRRRFIAWLSVTVLATGAIWYGITTLRNDPVPTNPVAQLSKPEHLRTAPVARESTPNALGSPLWSAADPQSATVHFSILRSRAEAGDMVAQRELAKLYQQCSVFSLSPENMYATLDAYAAARGVPQSTYTGIKHRFSATCSAVDGGQVIPQDAYTSWFERAANQGDTYSKVAVASKNFVTLGADDYLSLARDVINSGDPEAIFSLGDLLALAPESSDFAELKRATTGPYANYAWGVVACRMGADCGPASYRLDSLCINTGICGLGNFEDAIRNGAVADGQQESLDRAIEEVQRAVGKKPY
ncbi:hypothetical protein [Stenotrophomonas tuberculopleuritidis]|uniref:hypothetical protein n=1 Tax=Stenotrophomonas tuberculopleuritidis TaxID=3055079 RepID=UPI0026E511BE|nr:hypothetical protein [Stenotrophomonas sp. 704A1]